MANPAKFLDLINNKHASPKKERISCGFMEKGGGFPAEDLPFRAQRPYGALDSVGDFLHGGAVEAVIEVA